MYFSVDSLIDINNIITGSNNITLRKVNVKLCGYDKTYQLIDEFSERKIDHRDFYSELLAIFTHFMMVMEGLVKYSF